jgi:hypothetical protein
VISQLLIVCLRRRIELAHLRALDITIFIQSFLCMKIFDEIISYWGNLEQLLSLIEIDEVIVSKFDIEINSWSSCSVHVVQSSLGHGIENLIKVRVPHLVKVSEVIVEDYVKVVILQAIRLLVLGEDAIHDPLLISQRGLQVI